MRKKLVIYGGSSEISKHIINEFNNKYFYFVIFCRNDLKVNKKNILNYNMFYKN